MKTSSTKKLIITIIAAVCMIACTGNSKSEKMTNNMEKGNKRKKAVFKFKLFT